jgi:hypothetical protein
MEGRRPQGSLTGKSGHRHESENGEARLCLRVFLCMIASQAVMSRFVPQTQTQTACAFAAAAIYFFLAAFLEKPAAFLEEGAKLLNHDRWSDPLRAGDDFCPACDGTPCEPDPDKRCPPRRDSIKRLPRLAERNHNRD